MSIRSLFRRLSPNNDNQLLPTIASPRNPTKPPNPPLLHDSSFNPSTSAMTTPLPLTHQDSFQALSREEHHLRQSLQTLIDAQSEGLLAGFTGNVSSHPAAADDETLSITTDGSRTPTSESATTSSSRIPRMTLGVGISVVPVRQPARRKLGLQGARRGIARAMAQFEGLKAHEEELLEGALAAREEDLAVAEALGRKREGLEARIHGIEEEDASRKVSGLREEERLLDEEIRDMETKLRGMKTRHRYLLDEIEGLDNSVQSKLSSYKAALSLTEKETRNFLARPSAFIPAAATSTPASLGLGGGSSSQRGGNPGLWALPLSRRTLPMAQEQFREEQRALQQRIADAAEERTALEEGKQVWGEVVAEVSDVEKSLRDEMQAQAQAHSLVSREKGKTPRRGGGGPENTASAEAGDGERGMHVILKRIDAARARVEAHLRTCEARRWGLLVCCVGAELEALAQGSAVLRGVLGEEGQRVEGAGRRVGYGEEGRIAEGLGAIGSSREEDIIDHDSHLPSPSLSIRDSRTNRVFSDLRGGATAAADATAEEKDEETGDEDEDDGPGADLLLGLAA